MKHFASFSILINTTLPIKTDMKPHFAGASCYMRKAIKPTTNFNLSMTSTCKLYEIK